MSRPSETDARYQRYADAFEVPTTAESIERGWRVLHWEFAESWNGYGVVRQLAEKAQEIAAHMPDPIAGADPEPEAEAEP